MADRAPSASPSARPPTAARLAAARPAARSRRLARRALVAALALAALAAPACLGSTGNDRFAFEARLGGAERDATQPLSFTNTFGWTVTLTRADATVGPVYLNSIRPATVSPTGRLWSWLVKDAWAADEHLGSGLIVGEVLGQLRVDLLSPTLVTFPVPGSITGDTVRSAEIFYYPPPGTPPEAPQPVDPVTKALVAALEIEGTARLDARFLRFRGRLVLDGDWQPSGTPGTRNYTPITSVREVRGIPTSFVADEGGHLEIRIDAASLLRNANFDQIDTEANLDPEGVHVLQQAPGKQDQVMRSLYNELKASAGAYTVRWVPSP